MAAIYRRVLITHTIIRQLMGSTVVALDVGEELIRQGASVTVYASFIDEPASAYFAERGISLVSGDGASLMLTDYDLVWVQSQVLPLSFLEQLSNLERPAPTFVFNHMSALAYAPDEFPYIAGLEEALSSLSLYVSEECRQVAAPMYEVPPPSYIFPNPAPQRFVVDPRSLPTRPRRVAMVTNHLPDDLRRTAELLRRSGVEVAHWGEGGVRQDLVRPEDLVEFDLVISISKTVQSCLVAGCPVFVYDHFAGPGYLNDSNFEAASFHNFSGRGGFVARTPDQLAVEILDGYQDAVEYQTTHRTAFINRYGIERVLSEALVTVQQRTVPRLTPSQVAVYEAAERFGARFYQAWGERDHFHQLLDDTRRQLDDARGQLSEMRLQRDVATAEAQVLRTSWSFRVGQLVARPLTGLANVVSRRRARADKRPD